MRELPQYSVCLTSHNNKWLPLARAPKDIDDLRDLLLDEMRNLELIADDEDIESLEVYNPTISELVNAENPHAITMADIPRRAKVRVLAEEKTYRELSLAVDTPGILDKAAVLTVKIHSSEVNELKQQLIKGLKLSKGVNFDIYCLREKEERWEALESVQDLESTFQSTVRLQGAISYDMDHHTRGAWAGFADKTPFKLWDPNTSSYMGTRYFRRLGTNSKVIAIGIPCYNEERHSLKRTLESLHECYASTQLNCEADNGADFGGERYGYTAAAMIMIDGLEELTDSMRSYMEELFGQEARFEGPGGPMSEVSSTLGETTFISFLIEEFHC